MTTSPEPIRVLFIGGYGRSGSTLLDRILGETPGIVSLGEVRHLWREGLVENRRCGCGKPFRDCEFWGVVLDRAFGPAGPDVELIRALQLRVDQWWRLPTLARGAESPELHDYADALGAVYSAVAEQTGARVLVDSSKDVSHGYVLRHVHTGMQLLVLHLLRDPRATAYSWQRHKQNPGSGTEMDRWPAWQTAVEWNVINAGVAALRHLGVPYLRLRYEDFMAEPAESLDRIFAFIGMNAAGAVDDARTVHLSSSHTAAGNPDRFRSGDTVLRMDAEWQRAMSARDRLTVTGLCAVSLARSGYPLRLRDGRTAAGVFADAAN